MVAPLSSSGLTHVLPCRRTPNQRIHPLRHRRRRPLPGDRLRNRARHVVALRRRHLLRAAAHADARWGSPAQSPRSARSRGASSLLWRMRWRRERRRSASTCSTGRTRRSSTASRPIAPGTASRRIGASPGRPTAAAWRPPICWRSSDGRRPRFIHIDGEHSRAALTRDLELATAVLAPEGVIVLDDMLHPGYPTLMVAVHEYLGRHPEMCVLGVIDRETVVAATKFVLCRTRLVQALRGASCSRPTRTTSGRWAPTSSRTGASCCRSTRGWPRSCDGRHPRAGGIHASDC